MTRAALQSLATAVPRNVLRQSDVAAEAARLFASRMPDYKRIEGVFANGGIEERRAARPIEWYTVAQGWPERTAAFLETGTELFVEAAAGALEAAGIAAAEVDAVVTVCSTGIATPSLEARAARRLGFRPDIHRVPVFGLGCAGGVTGLAIAARLARAAPGTTVLLVIVELCTLSVRLDKADKANLVAVALFGDGAAACVLRTGSGIAAIAGAGEHTWPDTLGIMGWSVDPQGLGVIFDRAIPPFVGSELAPAIDSILAAEGRKRSEIDRFVCHPGGAKVVAAIEEALGLSPLSLDHERAVLADFGNMSAPTALFVLERVLKGGHGPSLALAALGPGFTLSCVLLERMS